MNNPQIDQLLKRIERLEKRVRDLTTLTYRSEVTGGVASYLFVDLPSPNIAGRLAIVTNGRKSGEGAGNGTGVLAVVLELSGVLQWVNADDFNQAIQV